MSGKRSSLVCADAEGARRSAATRTPTRGAEVFIHVKEKGLSSRECGSSVVTSSGWDFPGATTPTESLRAKRPLKGALWGFGVLGFGGFGQHSSRRQRFAKAPEPQSPKAPPRRRRRLRLKYPSSTRSARFAR